MANPPIPRLPGESDVDFRRRYHREWEQRNRRAAGIPQRGLGLGCSVEGCEKKAEAKGLCGKHYRSKWQAEKKNRTDLPPGKQDHPLYRIWWDRRTRDSLCEAWLDFTVFVKDIGERPSAQHFLTRQISYEKYGPDNWGWKEHSTRPQGETDKERWARKWQARKKNHPTFERQRHLVRHFGITPDRYDEMMAEQGGVCAICKSPETRVHPSTKRVCTLAVDHCHSTGIVRDLLCWRCNATIGRVEESIEVLRAMVAYLEKWADPASAAVGRPAPVAPNMHVIIIETEWGPMTASDAARRAGLEPSTVLSRIRYGWPEDRLLIPLRRPGRRGKRPELPS